MAFIGIDRGIREHWIYQDAEYFKVWFEMLASARFLKEPEKKLIDGEFLNIEYGQFIFGRVSWSERLNVSERRLRTLIDKLIKDKMITLSSKHRKFTLYTIINYSKYNHQNDQQNNQSYQGFEQYSDHQNDQRATSERPTSDQRATTQEESKESKESKQCIKEYSENTVELTNHLIFWLKRNNPNAKIPANLDKWHDAMDKLERIDKYNYMQIRSVIDWCQQDSFWKSNILSASKLRDKIGTLIMQMQRPKQQSGKISSFEKLKQLAKEEEEKEHEASGYY